MNIPDQIILVLKGKEGQILKAQDIKNSVIEKFGTNKDSILPYDFCYNRINIGERDPKIFEWIEKGKFKYLGVKYPYNGKIIARPKGFSKDIEVGYWRNGERTINIYPSELE